MELPPIATATVGSFPQPSWLVSSTQVGDRRVTKFTLDGDSLRQAQDDATVLSVLEQENAGLDLVTDGEQRRLSFINHILSTWEGIDLDKYQPKAIRRRTVERPVPSVVGQVQRRSPATVDDLLFVKARTGKPVKMAVPGPMTVIDSTYDEVYGDEKTLAMDIAKALNMELLDLQAAGADVLQIDEPAMTRYHEKVIEYGAEALDRCLEGVTVPTFVHLCYGYPGVGPRQYEYTYPELLELLMQTNIGGFSLEFARSNYDLAILSILRGRMIMFGCVDPGDSPPMPLQELVSQVNSALEYVEPEHLLLAPDCGLKTIDRKLAQAKARLLVETAEAVRQSL